MPAIKCTQYKKEKSLNKYIIKSNKKDIGYIFFLFIALFFLLQKESNCSTNISKRIKSLNHLIYIPQIGSSYNYLFCIRVPKQKVFKSQKKLY